MTKEDYAKSQIESDYDEYVYWLADYHNVDDINDVVDKVIKDAIYHQYLIQLTQYDEEDDIWYVDDYQVLEYDTKLEILKKLGLDEY